MLWMLIGCFADSARALTDFHDDAGYLVAQLHERGCAGERPCAMWDTGAFPTGPQQVAVARACAGECPELHAKVRDVVGEGWEGVTGVLARDNPLFAALTALGCTSRDACWATADGDGVVLESRQAGKQTRVATRR
jgi:hypothetical protein